MSILAAIIAFLRGIPALAGLGNTLAEMFSEYDKRGRIAQAAERRRKKDDLVRERLDALHGGMRKPASGVGQQQAPDVSDGLASGGPGGTGLGGGRTQDHQSTGATDRGAMSGSIPN